MSSTYIDLHNLSEITVDAIDVSNLVCDSIITTDLTVSGDLTGLTTSTSSIFNYTYNPSTRTFTLGLANQAGVDYILITDSSGVFQSVLFTPLIYPLLSASSPILYNSTTGNFSFDSSANLTLTGTINVTTGVNISSGQTYKINNVAQTFLNQLTTTPTSTITHTFSSPNLQSNINNLSISNGMLAGSIDNSKLLNSSISLNGQSMSLGSTYTIPALSITNAMIAGSIALSKIVIGTANQFLQTSSTLINNWVSMSGDSTLINGILTIANNAITTAKILNSAVTLDKIATSAYSSIDTPSVLVQRDSNSNISCSTITYSAPLAPISSARILSITVPTTYPAVSTSTIGYHDVLYTSLFGDDITLGSVAPLWDRVEGINTMERTMYSKGILPTFKIEGQLVNFYIAPNDQVRINIAVFKNVGSTAVINVANCISSLFVTRNLIIGSTEITPFICYFAEGDATQIAGTAYTFTVCTQTGGFGVCNTGRFTNDIPSHLFVTQIS